MNKIDIVRYLKVIARGLPDLILSHDNTHVCPVVVVNETLNKWPSCGVGRHRANNVRDSGDVRADTGVCDHWAVDNYCHHGQGCTH